MTDIVNGVAGLTLRDPVLTDPRLSVREVQVLVAWIRSDSKQIVAQTPAISMGTVNTHLARVRDKYDQAGRPATTKASLLARALQDGHISIDEL